MAYSTKFDDALLFASDIHRHQTRKGIDVPYIKHLLAVASIVGTYGGTEDQVIGGLLHDAIEDCAQSVPDIARQIRERFGDEVLAIVEACSDTDEFPKPPWKARKDAYIAHLADSAPDAPYLLVSLADKVHNASCIVQDFRVVGDALWERFNKAAGREGTIWYYRELSNVFLKKLPGPLADELARIVNEMEAVGE